MVKSELDTPAINFNFDLHFKEINERFTRLIKQLGSNNKKGSARYQFEVDFTHALNEISTCPIYLQGKMFDEAIKILNELSSYIKSQQEEKQVESPE